MKVNTRIKAQAIKVGDDVKPTYTTPGAKAGVATSRAINRAINTIGYGMSNVVEFTICFWKGNTQ